ncbi:hypothetical protein [Herpetosiphon llansteffanensis]|uniref:hypothetical protein n=1 Tax=Herpetosiphon llansteffanensis TaxID=2094568 RepID=UPI000D7C31D1|nr:hypothetical protein [Herpetosiphon llansteffanensis]
MTITYQAIIDQLHQRFATLSSLVRLNASGQNVALLTEEPKTISQCPTLYSLLEHVTYAPSTPVTISEVVILSRLVVADAGSDRCEAALMPYVFDLPATINGSSEGRRLGNWSAMRRGIATVERAEAVWVAIGGKQLYRALDMYTRITLQ